MSTAKPVKGRVMLARISMITDRIADLASLFVIVLVPILWATGKLPMNREAVMLYVSTILVVGVSLALYKAKRARRR